MRATMQMAKGNADELLVVGIDVVRRLAFQAGRHISNDANDLGLAPIAGERTSTVEARSERVASIAHVVQSARQAGEPVVPFAADAHHPRHGIGQRGRGHAIPDVTPGALARQ